MIYVGIDIAKNKHDCFVVDSNGEVIADVFTIENTIEGFNKLLGKIPNVPKEKVKIGLESTGHYSNNLINYLHQKGFGLIVLNPLRTNLFHKAQTLRKTKTDKIDAKIIAKMIYTEDYKSYTPLSYHINEIKSLTRSRSRLVKYCSQYKISITRILSCLFPELANKIPLVHQKSIYAMLLEYPSSTAIASCHLTRLTNILKNNSKGKYGKDVAEMIKNLAKQSIGCKSDALEMELKINIKLVQEVQKNIKVVESRIKLLMQEINSPITSIPGISYVFGSIILSEIGDIHRFSSPAKLLAFAGLDPSTRQSGKFHSRNAKMVKRGSTYLRAAIMSAARSVAMYDSVFKKYLSKKRDEGKHYNVALSHVSRKLVRMIYHLLKNNEQYVAS